MKKTSHTTWNTDNRGQKMGDGILVGHKNGMPWVAYENYEAECKEFDRQRNGG